MNAKDFLLEENPDKEPMPFGAVVNIMEAYADSLENDQAELEKCIEERKAWCAKAMEAANDRLNWQNRATGLQREIISLREESNRMKQCLYEYGEWARANGERHRGNLQKNNEQLFNQFLKEREQWIKLKSPK